MVDINRLETFCKPFYEGKDIVHDLWHIRLMKATLERMLRLREYAVDNDALLCALWFHGFVYSHEDAIRSFLASEGIPPEAAEKIIRIAWESQKQEAPETLEGKILHDAHVLEGGKTYLVVKTVAAGTARGQSLSETLNYLKEHVLDRHTCFLPESQAPLREMNAYARDFLNSMQDAMDGMEG